jgi:tRNA(fMet)-specific endonuclease VapC
MRYILDTNIISELVKKKPNRRVAAWIDDLDADSVYLSVLSIGEVCKGIERLPPSSRKEQLTNWLHDYLLIRFSDNTFNVDTDVMLTWGKLIASMQASGATMSTIDSIIAATAIHYHCTLVTRNVNHFLSAAVAVLNPWDV